MPVFPPIPLIRRKLVIRKLSEKGAFTEETAKTFKEAGIINPNAFTTINEKLVEDKVLVKTKNNKYYINK